jgi:RNA 3'-phosphate cyclase
LQAQHLKSVEAAAKISGAEVDGAKPGSQSLIFRPGPVKSGNYQLDIGTAGSTSLVLQTIFMPLSQAAGTSTVTITGGTHVPWSPCYHYLELHWLSYLRQIGCEANLNLETAGFYPAGGGRICATIRPSPKLEPLTQMNRGELQRIEGLSGVANLDPEIARRQKLQALRRLEPLCRNTKIKTLELPSPVKGTFILLSATFEHAHACYTALGAPGKRAEMVADEAVNMLLAFLGSGGAMDEHLADQLLLPLALANGSSRFCTSQVTQHLITNAEVIRQFLSVKITIQGALGETGTVSVEPL